MASTPASNGNLMGVTHLGPCGFERGMEIKGQPKHASFGNLYFDSENHRASLLVKSIYLGQFICKPAGDNPPYIKGDIMFRDGVDESGNSQYRWCGFIYSDQNATGGTIYNGVLKMIPIKLIAQTASEPGTKPRDGIWLNVWLEDK